MSFPKPTPRIAALVALVVTVMVAPNAPAQGSDQVRSLLGQGWTYMEAGSLRQAEEAFTAAFNTPEGRNTAEVYYAVAAVWWERRNAMASYMWLSDAQKASRDSYTWNGGPEHEWDRRIGSRRRFVEQNFTVVKLRSPKRGRPAPPLSDPPPPDPLLREFTDRLQKVVDEGVEAKVAVQWVLLPNGTYWVGDDLLELGGGELDPARAESWELLKDGGKVRRDYDQRVAAIASGDSMAVALLGDAAQQTEAERQAEADRIARQEEERRLEEERLADELRRAEEDRLRREEEERRAEEQRRDEEERRTEEERQAEEQRLAEAERRAEEERSAEEQRRAEEARRAEEQRLAEEARRAEEQRRADDERRAEAERRADEERRAEEQRRADEERLAEQRRVDEERLAEQRRRADEERLAEERRRAEEAEVQDAEAARREAELEVLRRQDEERAAEERRLREERLAEEQRTADEEQRTADEEERTADEEEREALRAEEEAARLAEEQRHERDRRDGEWDEARRRMEEQQQAERQDADARRADVREGRSDATGPNRETDSFTGRRLLLAGGVGGVTVSRMTADGSEGEVDWTLGGEGAYLVPLTKKGIALGIGLSYANLPVSGCSEAQTRASAVSLHVGPRVPVPLGKRTWLSIRGGIHVGGAGTWPGATVRDACAQASLGVSSASYGVRLADGDATARVSFAELGWRGYAVVLGPDVEIAAMFGAGAAPAYIGAAAYIRHDQVFALVQGDTYRFRDEGSATLALHSTSVPGFGGKASMARFQFGLRGVVMF